MKIYRLEDMVRGWFVGNFTPCAYKTDSCEVAVKHYKANYAEKPHYHAAATEITVFVSGEALMNGRKFIAGDIVVLEPNETCSFECLKDTITVVFKSASIKNDKFYTAS